MKQSVKRFSRNPNFAFIKILLFTAFLWLLGWSIHLIREKLLLNANEMGMHLAQSYATEEENRISVYSMLLSVGASSLQDRVENGADNPQLQAFLSRYASQLEEVLQTYIIDPYAVIDGKIVAANPWDGDGDYDYSSSEWYQRTLASRGDIIYTDAYEDVITGKKVVTLATALGDSQNVLAFDILLENFHTHKNKSSLPMSSTYYLFDSNDNLMYLTGDVTSSSQDMDPYLHEMVSNIRQGKYENHDTFLEGPDGRSQGVYYYEMSNGWLSVMTIPVDAILQGDLDGTIILLSVFCVILSAVALFIMVHGYLKDRKMRQISETVQILGDSYYAIYRVNFTDETYITVKSSEDVRDELRGSGSYQHLLDVVKTVVDESTHETFEKNLSARNIRKLINEGVYDFSGDYQRNFNGVYKWVNIQVLYNQALHLDEVILAFREIDAIKRRELQQHMLLEGALAAAKKTVQQKNMFFSNASHDMRTPLNAIIGLAKLAQKPDTSRETMEDYIQKILRSGEQLLTLVNDVLDMSRLEHGKGGNLDYAPMNIVNCVKDCADSFHTQSQAEQKRLDVSVDVAYPNVYCDLARLNQILNNLISNAFKYSPEGAQIQVSLRELNHQPGHSKYQIVVSDTGIGMSQEFLSHIFEPFSREATFTSQKVTGTGLGMPIVKTLVQQMSGEITVQSTPGKGSVFTVTIPLQIAQEGEAPAPVAPVESSFSLEGKTILLAEDNEINMEVATECLSMVGAKVLQAWNGQEAVDVFRATIPGDVDAILMDMQMPVMDGCGAARAIRSLPREDAKTIPIIAVTANVFAEDIAKTTEAGMNAHISKPIDFLQLEEVLKAHIK